MKAINSPLFCLTSDTDWASDYAIRDFLTLVSSFGVRATVFATHKSPVLEEFLSKGAIELGVHPNFLPGSSHGNDVISVVEHMCSQFPDAQAFRSHHFVDSTDIAREMVRRGVRYDSNLCLYLQPGLRPLRHWSGLTRFPVFWEDDVHWTENGGDWQLDKVYHHFMSPGLKVLNFHPFFVAANIPNHEYYVQIKEHIPTLSAANIESIRFSGEGTRTFLVKLLEALSSHRFYTLGELHQMLPIQRFVVREDGTTGRHTERTDEQYTHYWNMSDEEKQQFLKEDFEQRDAKDPYATSRDGYLRELEIYSIEQNLGEKGGILDLGCGNGYTLISLAIALREWEMTGVDFATNLIRGANEILEERRAELHSRPTFCCADAIEYVKRCEDASFNYVITERFIQNLPSINAQKDMIEEVYRVLAPRGRLLMCEGSQDGFEALNDVRESVGLHRIPATSKDNIEAIRFKDTEIERFAEESVGFVLRTKVGYSTYFLIARVLHPLLVSPQNPRFDAKINEIAMQIQKKSRQEPGYGSNTLWVFEK